MLKVIGKFLTLLGMALMASSCGNKSKSNDNSVVLDAYRLIDSDRTDEAIELLEKSISKDPENREFKLVLASAYAHKGGFKIQKFLPLIGQRQNFSKITEGLKKKNLSISKSESAALSIANILHSAAGVFEIYAMIPILDENQRVYITHAIDILKEIPDLKPEDALYKAVLEIVVFKHVFSTKLVAEFTPPKDKNEQNCRLDLINVNDSIIEMGKLLIDIFTDLSIAKPNSHETMKAISEDVADAVSEISIVTTTITVIEEASQIFLKQLAIQNGLGKLIKCN